MRRMVSLKKYIDIGANLTDDMYQGVYHGSKKHDPDLDRVLNRSWAAGMNKMIITGGSLVDSKKAIELANSDARLFATVGCHPTRCTEFVSNPDTYLAGLKELITENLDKVVAIGECGLDYERLKFCEKDVQLKYFEYQLQLSKEFNLPLFLHCRAAADDLVEILQRNRESIVGGVVHSFDGTQDALEKILDLGLYIGINGCSLRTEENIAVASIIPQDRLMIETDSPWCEVKPTHAGYSHVETKYLSVKKEKHHIDSNNQVKGRNEPVNIVSDSEYESVSVVAAPIVPQASTSNKKRTSTNKRKAPATAEDTRTSKKKATPDDLFGLEESKFGLNPTGSLTSSIVSRVANGKVRRTIEGDGDYYIELKVYRTADAVTSKPEERWKKAQIGLKLQTNEGTLEWEALQKFVKRGFEVFSKAEPIFYSG